MSPNSRRTLIVISTVAFLVAVGIGYIVYPFWSSWRAIEAKQNTLLFGTDHAALLGACRDVWQNRSNFGKDEGGYVYVDPSNPKLPAAIRALDAHAIDAWPSGVSIVLGGQGCHYGFEAFLADVKADDKRTVWKDEYPSKVVADGLWYYAENGLPQKK